MAENDSQEEREARLERELREQAEEFGRLDKEDERDLLQRVPEARATEALVKHNLDLVVSQAEAHLGRGLPFSDLYQEGTIGLVDAVGAYTGQGEFREFASLHIGLQMDSLIESEDQARKETQEDVADVKTLDMAQVMFRRQNGRDARPVEMQKSLGWDEGRLERIERMLDLARERNDAATINFLDASEADELGIDFVDEQPDPRRRPQGAGPDSDES
jgi:DNA-directed RNA polymerase sigma subunit (sigma70/sigma32)